MDEAVLGPCLTPATDTVTLCQRFMPECHMFHVSLLPQSQETCFASLGLVLTGQVNCYSMSSLHLTSPLSSERYEVAERKGVGSFRFRQSTVPKSGCGAYCTFLSAFHFKTSAFMRRPCSFKPYYILAAHLVMLVSVTLVGATRTLQSLWLTERSPFQTTGLSRHHKAHLLYADGKLNVKKTAEIIMTQSMT